LANRKWKSDESKNASHDMGYLYESMSGLLLETGVTVEGSDWELVDTISSLLLFWFMEASILLVVDNIDDSFCMK
jgi:hypothetical protein